MLRRYYEGVLACGDEAGCATGFLLQDSCNVG